MHLSLFSRKPKSQLCHNLFLRPQQQPLCSVLYPNGPQQPLFAPPCHNLCLRPQQPLCYPPCHKLRSHSHSLFYRREELFHQLSVRSEVRLLHFQLQTVFDGAKDGFAAPPLSRGKKNFFLQKDVRDASQEASFKDIV